MSSPIWTPAALSSEAREYQARVWRFVEAQHHVSTLKLVDNLAEHEILEALIEDTKPKIPPECQHLDYLISTPFRYNAPYPNGSRFRRAGLTPGVFYAAEHPETALAEIIFCRLLFFADSPQTQRPAGAPDYTAFAVSVRAHSTLDLTKPRLVEDSPLWTDVSDYAPCQNLAEQARIANIQIIRYQSVRDPARRANLAVLACSAFSSPKPVERRTWRIRLGGNGAQAICEHPHSRVNFQASDFSADPRLRGLNWK